MLDDINFLLFFPSRICVRGEVYDNFILCCGHPCLHSLCLRCSQEWSITTQSREGMWVCVLLVIVFVYDCIYVYGCYQNKRYGRSQLKQTDTHILMLSSLFFRKCKKLSVLLHSWPASGNYSGLEMLKLQTSLSTPDGLTGMQSENDSVLLT